MHCFPLSTLCCIPNPSAFPVMLHSQFAKSYGCHCLKINICNAQPAAYCQVSICPLWIDGKCNSYAPGNWYIKVPVPNAPGSYISVSQPRSTPVRDLLLQLSNWGWESHLPLQWSAETNPETQILHCENCLMISCFYFAVDSFLWQVADRLKIFSPCL